MHVVCGVCRVRLLLLLLALAYICCSTPKQGFENRTTTEQLKKEGKKKIKKN